MKEARIFLCGLRTIQNGCSGEAKTSHQ